MANKAQVRQYGPIKSERILTEIEAVLEEVLTQAGKHAVFYHLQTKYSVNLDDAVEKPAEFAAALVSFFGEFGAKVLVARMVQRVYRLTGIRYDAPLQAKDFEAAVQAASGGLRADTDYVGILQ